MIRSRAKAGLGCLGVLLVAATAHAQDTPQLRAHRLILGGGVVWSGGYGIGGVNAELRSNAAGSAPPPFTLFSASSDVGRAASAELRIGFALTPQLVIEGGGSFGTPHIGVAISSDPEVGAQRIAGEQLKQYLFDAALAWQVPMRLGRRARPFVIAGGGHLRQLHEERTMVETGQIYYAGVGARYWFRGGRGRSRSLGLRADVRANARRGGIDFANRVRLFPSLALQMFVGL